MPLNEGHGAIRPPDLPPEYERVVVGTHSLPSEDWRRCAVASWLMQALIGLRLAYYVVLVLVDRFHLPYMFLVRAICEAFRDTPVPGVLARGVADLYAMADRITQGRPRTQILTEFGDIYWEPEEAFYLGVSGDLQSFYADLGTMLLGILRERRIAADERLIQDVVLYQQARVPRHGVARVEPVTLRFNIPQYFDGYFAEPRHALRETPCIVRPDPSACYPDTKTFARHVILFGRKSGRMCSPVTWEGLSQPEAK
jgi:hypothetical protein